MSEVFTTTKKLCSTNWSSLELTYRMKIVSTRIVARLTMKVILTRAICLTLVRNRFGSRAMYLALFVCSNMPNFEQPKCFITTSPQHLLHDKMQYLETVADAAFEMLKEKFQYVFDQLEPENKQHQAVKG